MIKLLVENNFQQKIMMMSFAEDVSFNSKSDIDAWKKEWMTALKSWHSPYKLVLNAQKVLTIDPSILDQLTQMFVFFEKLFMRKCVYFGLREGIVFASSDLLISAINEDDAFVKAGLRERTGLAANEQSSLKESIQIENHFAQHVMELSFNADAKIETKADILVLKNKLTNALMQWHSKWSLLVDCSKLTMNQDIHEDFKKMEIFFRGFFLKKIVGYLPAAAKETYPFEVARVRHKAAALIENEGSVSGDDANCRSRGTTKSS